MMSEFDRAVIVSSYIQKSNTDEFFKLFSGVFGYLYRKDSYPFDEKFMQCDFDHYNNKYNPDKLHYHLIDEMILTPDVYKNAYDLVLAPDRFLFKGIYWSEWAEQNESKIKKMPIYRHYKYFNGYRTFNVFGVNTEYIKSLPEIAIKDKNFSFIANVIISDYRIFNRFFKEDCNAVPA